MIIGMFFALSAYAYAEEAAKPDRAKFFTGIEYHAGFMWGKLDHKPTYRLPQIAVDFDFDLKRTVNLKIPQLLQFQIEPFFGVSSQPGSNIETGALFLLKLGLLPETSKFQPFGVIGAGVDYMTLHTSEQGTQFNFIETAGIGAHYFFKKNSAFTVQGRIRHLSNCGIDTPNSGINTYSVLVGLTRLF